MQTVASLSPPSLSPQCAGEEREIFCFNFLAPIGGEGEGRVRGFTDGSFEPNQNRNLRESCSWRAEYAALARPKNGELSLSNGNRAQREASIGGGDCTVGAGSAFLCNSTTEHLECLGEDHEGSMASKSNPLTAYTGIEARTRAIAAGFQVHIAKPVESAHLASVIADLCGRGGQHLRVKPEP